MPKTNAETAWPADKVERRAVSALIPYARNARTHSDAQVAQIAASITEWGWTVPVLVDETGGIIAGHGRVMAARKLGLEDVPVMVAKGWSEAQKQAYVLADNQLALNAGWDAEMLKVELTDLAGAGFDVGLIGFSEDELAKLTADKTEGLTDPDAVPDAPVKSVTVPNDVWLLGNHRVMCGDSTSVDAIDKLMAGERADLLFTSPPYAQQRDYGAAKEKVGQWDALMEGVFSVVPVKNGAQMLVNLGLVHREGEWLPYWDKWIEWMRNAGWRRFGWYVWDQGPGLPGDWNGRLAPSHEFIFHFNREPMKANKTVESKHGGKKIGGGGLRGKDGVVKEKTGAGRVSDTHRIPDSVFRIMRHKGGIGSAGKHPAIFPVALVEEVLKAYSKAGDVIFEPFCGSGTQVIAAEKSARHCFGMELDPVYVDVAIKRWQDFTGQKATLEGDGRTFEELTHARA